MLCYVGKKNGELYSFIDPHCEPKFISFVVRGRKFIGSVYALSSDLKAIHNYQIGTLKLLSQTLIRKQIPQQWKRSTKWVSGRYDYWFDAANNTLWIYIEGNAVARFFMPANANSYLVEYFIESQIKLLEEYIRGKAPSGKNKATGK